MFMESVLELANIKDISVSKASVKKKVHELELTAQRKLCKKFQKLEGAVMLICMSEW